MSESASLNSYFEQLDRAFHRIEKVEDDTFIYKSSDVLVQSTLEVPIIIQWPDSVVKFEFTSQLGDISFGIIFVPAPEEDKEVSDNDIETIEETARVSSDLESYGGSFIPPCEGIVFFIWDNGHDWISVKKVSYVIEVEQPSFTYVDRLRISAALPELRDTVELLDIDLNRYADAEDCLENNTANILFLEDQIAHLRQKLDSKVKEFLTLSDEMIEIQKCIEFTSTVTSGLALRQLERPILAQVLSFLLPLEYNREIALVCRYWHSIVDDLIHNRIIPPSSHNRSHKVEKSEIKRMLSLIYQQAAFNKPSTNEDNNNHYNVHNQTAEMVSKIRPSIAASEYSTKKATAFSTILSDSSDHQSSSSQHSLSPLPTAVGGALLRSTSLEISYGDLLPQNALDPSLLTRKTTPVSPFHPSMSNNNAAIVGSSSAIANITNGKRISGAVKPPKRQPLSGGVNVSWEAKSASPIPIHHQQQNSPIIDDVNHEDSFDPSQPHQSHLWNENPNSSAVVRVNGHHTHGRHHRNKKEEQQLVHFMQKIRGEQQISQFLEYISAGYAKIEGLQKEKRRIKKLIRAWNATYQKTHGRLPTSTERKGHLRELHEEYQQVSLALKIKSQKMDQFLLKVGLTKEKYEELRHNK